jgi:aminopeptidase YwaD
MSPRGPPLALAVALAVLAACGPRLARRSGPEPVLDGGRARAEVAWLADPARGGRGVGTPGGAEAVRFIGERLREAGLAPAFEGSYAQPFEAPFRATLQDGNALRVGAYAAAVRDEWLPFGFSDDGSVEGELVWAGYGISAPDLGYDDYAGLDVRGKVVLVAADFPRESDPGSPFRDPRHYRLAEWRAKAIHARERGAAALVAVRDGWAHEGPDEIAPWRGQAASRAGIVAVRATAAALARGGVDVGALAAPGELDGKPRSRPLGLHVRVEVKVLHERAETWNVAAIVPGRDPAVAGECVVVGAHHDHLGLGGDASSAPEQLGTVHPGADDNASGVAALLAVARAFAAEPPPRRTVLLAAFGAEEQGLLGSAHLVRELPAPCRVDKLQLMVNLDMVGRLRGGKVYVAGGDTAKGLRDVVTALVERPAPLPLRLAFAGDGYGPSDHMSFHAHGVPVLFLFTGPHGDYHRPSDTADKIDADGLVLVARLAHRIAYEAAERDRRLEVLRAAAAPPRPPGGERGYGAYFGAIPDFAERDAPGVLLAGTRPGSPAERAGLAERDVLLRVGATSVRNLQDLAFALRSHRAGDEVEVEWEREGARRVARVRLEERR